MRRGISLDGVPVPNSKATGAKSYRSDDGSDLPARVYARRTEYRERTGLNPVRVYLGDAEWAELEVILGREIGPVGTLPIRVAGLHALHDRVPSRLEVI